MNISGSWYSSTPKEHEPIHVHGFYQGRESKAEIIVKDGKVARIVFRPVSKMPPLTGRELSDFKKLVRHRAQDIVKKWIDYFVLKKAITTEKITRKLK